MNLEEINKALETDPDFVNLPKFNYSLKNLLDIYPEGVPPRLIASALLMSEEEVNSLYNKIVNKLKFHMKTLT